VSVSGKRQHSSYHAPPSRPQELRHYQDAVLARQVYTQNDVEDVILVVYFDHMAVLRNIRHEAFAQAVANGHSALKAHEISGFSPDRANAGRLRHRDDISRRVDEILATRTKAIDKALISAAERVGVDEAWVLRNLKRNAVMAMRAGDRAAAARSIELIGKHLGMFIDRKQVEIAYVDDADEYLAKIMALVDGKVIDDEPPAIDYEPAEPDDSVH
jgi:hypothetical protein